MFKVQHSCALSLVLVFCTLFMLFSNTCVVKAAGSSYSYSFSFNVSSDSTTNSENTNGVNTSVYYTGAGWYEVAFTPSFSTSSLTANDYLRVRLASISASGSGCSKYYITDPYNTVVWSYTSSVNTTAYTNFPWSDFTVDNVFNGTYILHFYCDFSGVSFDYTDITYSTSVSFSTTVYYDAVSSSSISSSTVSDSETHDLLEEQNETAEETLSVTTSIFSSISDFFSSFFTNIINSLVSVFVPDDDFFSTWFSNLNDLLAEKLGMLYAPFDLLVSVLNSIYSSDTSFSGIPIPEISFNDTVLIEEQTFNFSDLGDTYEELQGYVYFGTDVVILFAFLTLLQKKIQLVMRGSESG